MSNDTLTHTHLHYLFTFERPCTRRIILHLLCHLYLFYIVLHLYSLLRHCDCSRVCVARTHLKMARDRVIYTWGEEHEKLYFIYFIDRLAKGWHCFFLSFFVLSVFVNHCMQWEPSAFDVWLRRTHAIFLTPRSAKTHNTQIRCVSVKHSLQLHTLI